MFEDIKVAHRFPSRSFSELSIVVTEPALTLFLLKLGILLEPDVNEHS